MRLRSGRVFSFLAVFVALVLAHYPLLRLPFFWDEAGYYIPAALDFYRSGLLIPISTRPTGHTPLAGIYLAIVWRILGFTPFVTRTAMLLVAAGTVVSLYALGQRVAGRQAGAWSALLLAASPLFFAQSSLAHLDLFAALFTTLAVLALLVRSMAAFALTASLAILSKETAVMVVPVAWAFAWHVRRELSRKTWVGLAAPLFPLVVWIAHYHRATGYWTGNPEYLEYNLYSTLHPTRFFWSLLRRLYEIFVGGFNWLLAAGALWAVWRQRKRKALEGQQESTHPLQREVLYLTAGLIAAYALLLSLVGGAILPRYLLPIFPLGYLAAVVWIERLPRAAARSLCLAAVTGFVGGWFLNPPYPFPFEDNLSYADFVRLHQQGAQFLEGQPAGTRILTAWPASDELTRPMLGYVRQPLRVVPIQGFTARDFTDVSAQSFDVLYIYSRKWEPPDNWLERFPRFQEIQLRYFDYAPQVPPESLAFRYRLALARSFERRGQWARIYRR